MFNGETGDVDLQQKDVNGNGELFINSGVENNGIKGRTDRQARVFPANTITVDFWGNANYRDEPYKLATHNHVFSLSGSVIRNRSVGLYLVAAMSFLTRLFSYANMGTWPKIMEQGIILPVVSQDSDEIDFAYMEARIRELEEARIRELEAYLTAAGFANCELTADEQAALDGFGAKVFKPFKIGTMFDIVKGKRLRKEDMIPGTIPFIGATALNNGVTAFVGNPGHIHKGNLITVSYNGSVGEAFYQATSFRASDDINVFYGKVSGFLNELCALFICAALRVVGKRYGYNFKWAKEIMEEDSILLPADSTGAPDLAFMENYIRAHMKEAIQGVWAWRGREIAATRAVSSGPAAHTEDLSHQGMDYSDLISVSKPSLAAQKPGVRPDGDETTSSLSAEYPEP